MAYHYVCNFKLHNVLLLVPYKTLKKIILTVLVVEGFANLPHLLLLVPKVEKLYPLYFFFNQFGTQGNAISVCGYITPTRKEGKDS